MKELIELTNLLDANWRRRQSLERDIKREFKGKIVKLPAGFLRTVHRPRPRTGKIRDVAIIEDKIEITVSVYKNGKDKFLSRKYKFFISDCEILDFKEAEG